MGRIQKDLPKISYILLKNLLKFDFVLQISLSNYQLFSHYCCLILLYFHDFELNSEKQILKISVQSNALNITPFNITLRLMSHQSPVPANVH